MMALQSLKNIFQDNNYAWALLENQINIELALEPDGRHIAKLLQLYMRGVQKMNSKMDPRQSYFKNKVSSLMSKQTVIRSLNNKSMKKKKTPFQDKQSIKKVGLIEKKKQLQMRMAYGVEQNNADNLRKMLQKQADRQIKLTNKIQNIYNHHEEKLMQRIRHRKLKTATARSISSHIQSYTGNNQHHQRRKITKKFEEIIQEIKQPTREKIKVKVEEKKSKSLQIPNIPESFEQIDSPRKSRRMTEELIRSFG